MNLEKADSSELYLRPGIYIKKSDVHRWGVFTKEDIKQFDVIQESPYMTFDGTDALDESDVISRYLYGTEGGTLVSEYVIGFGFASLYNHSTEPTVEYELDVVNEVMRHYAVCDIPAGSELFIDYGLEVGEEDWGDY